ncbi:MAG: T9SS type A sorting domain-containing protein [Ignavibacteriae bacterium]|nr:T9SS type A sorting domain-containing protein [Ignavibacteriota bacterium]
MKRLIVVVIMLVSLSANAQWIQYPLSYTGFAYTLGFYDVNRGLSFGHTMFPFNQNLYYTTNSGSNWVMANYPMQLRAFADVQYINANIVYAGGSENVVLKSSNSSRNDFRNFPKFLRERLLREGKREYSVEYKSAFIKSSDGGVNWQRGSEFDTLTGFITDIHFLDINTGYALIDSTMYGRTRFYKTTNAGTNWNMVCRIDTAEVDKMVFLDANTGIAKGYSWGGRIYRTTNAGVNWAIKEMPTQIDGLTFFNQSTGIAIGIQEAGATTKVYRTTDAGINWNVVYTNPGRQYQNIKAIPNTGTAFAVGNLIDTVQSMYGKITTLKTTNYGFSWVVKEFNPPSLMFGVGIADANNFFIGGGDVYGQAIIMKSTNGGNVFVNNSGSEIPSAYSLEQNYPNPFNPSTVIRFELSVVSDVSLKVYDVQGREVATLVNEKMNAGKYEVWFDALLGGSSRELASGIYFYRMVTDGYSETRKMFLLK